MTYQRFEDLLVWPEAARLYGLIDDFLIEAAPSVPRSYRDPSHRAVLSISNTIAEGFERGTTKDLINYIYIARGSAGEVRSMLTVAECRPQASPIKPKVAALSQLPKVARVSCGRIGSSPSKLANLRSPIPERRNSRFSI
jgi:four helix bundle protein